MAQFRSPPEYNERDFLDMSLSIFKIIDNIGSIELHIISNDKPVMNALSKRNREVQAAPARISNNISKVSFFICLSYPQESFFMEVF